jgi:hypothetical protein
MLMDAELDRMESGGGRRRSRSACASRGAHGTIRQRTVVGAALAGVLGSEQLRACLDDAMRAAEHGFRSVLISDLGVLAAFAELRRAGSLPSDMQAKVSVMAAIGNPATAKMWQELGADTLNVPGDLGLGQLSAMRAAIAVPLDLYVESPDDLRPGSPARRGEPDPVAARSVKAGAAQAPALYPWGGISREPRSRWGRETRPPRSDRDGATRAGIDTRTSVPGAGGWRCRIP